METHKPKILGPLILTSLVVTPFIMNISEHNINLQCVPVQPLQYVCTPFSDNKSVGKEVDHIPEKDAKPFVDIKVTNIISSVSAGIQMSNYALTKFN